MEVKLISKVCLKTKLILIVENTSELGVLSLRADELKLSQLRQQEMAI